MLLGRRKAANPKRKRLYDAEHPKHPSKESSDEDNGAVATDPKPRMPHPSSSVTHSAHLLQPPLPSPSVFASDAVEPSPSSLPQFHFKLQLTAPVVPSTPLSSKSAIRVVQPGHSYTSDTDEDGNEGAFVTSALTLCFANAVRSKVPLAGGSSPLVPEESGIINPRTGKTSGQGFEGRVSIQLRIGQHAPWGEHVNPPSQCTPTRLTVCDGQGTSRLRDTTSNSDASQAGEEYASSPLPCSSPVQASRSKPRKAPRRRFRHFDHTFSYLLRVTDRPQGAVGTTCTLVVPG